MAIVGRLIRTYDPAEVYVTWTSNGDTIEMNEGFAPDTFLTIVPDTPRFHTRVGIGGRVARILDDIDTASVNITLMQNSNINKALMTAINTTGLGMENDDIGSITIKDSSNTILVTLTDCYLESYPTFNLGSSYGVVEWSFKSAKMIGNDVAPDAKGGVGGILGLT